MRKAPRKASGEDFPVRKVLWKASEQHFPVRKVPWKASIEHFPRRKVPWKPSATDFKMAPPVSEAFRETGAPSAPRARIRILPRLGHPVS